MGNNLCATHTSKTRSARLDSDGDEDEYASSRNPANGGSEPPRLAKDTGLLFTTPWPSQSFQDLVASHDPEEHGDAVDSLKEFLGEDVEMYDSLLQPIEQNPRDSHERQVALIQAYTAESPIYHEMNTALRNDDAEKMKQLKGYIWELREVFQTDGINQITTPHTGTLYRGINFPDPENDVKQYQKDEKFAWPAFTSTSTDRNAALNFGNIIFEIRCYPVDGLFDDDKPEFAPAGVSQWSQFPQEAEIIFPPNTEFRVVNIQYPGTSNDLGQYENVYALVQCEVTSFDSVYGMIEAGDTEGVKKWTEQNGDRLRTDDCEHSLLDHAEEHEDKKKKKKKKKKKDKKTRGVDLNGESESELSDSPLAVLMRAGAT